MRKGVQHEAGGVIHLDRCVGRQNEAGITNNRESANRRRWPADSQRQGQSATPSRAKAARAASSAGAVSRRSRPCSAAQKASVSRGVNAGLTPS